MRPEDAHQLFVRQAAFFTKGDFATIAACLKTPTTIQIHTSTLLMHTKADVENYLAIYHRNLSAFSMARTVTEVELIEAQSETRCKVNLATSHFTDSDEIITTFRWVAYCEMEAKDEWSVCLLETFLPPSVELVKALPLQ